MHDSLRQRPADRGVPPGVLQALGCAALLGALAATPPAAASGWEARLPAALQLPGPCDDRGASGRLRGLLVGVDTYREVDAAGRPWFVPLAGSANDAQLLLEILKRRSATGPDDLKPLLDRDATTDGFYAALNELIATTRCGDFVVLHFSGHTWRGALALADASIRNGSGLVFEGELRRAVTALRNRGAFVLVHLDANTPEPLQLDVGRGARWRAAGTGESALELSVGAGGLATFSAGPLAFEQKLLVPTPEGGQQTRVYGLFSFATAAALGGGAQLSVRELADRIRQGLAVLGRSGIAPQPAFEATEPDRRAFTPGLAALTAAPAAAPGPARIEIQEPKRTRGVMLVTEPTLRVSGLVTSAARLAAVVVQGVQAQVLEGGRFAAEVVLKPGVHSLYAVALFSDNSIATDSVEVQGAAAAEPLAGAGRSYALVIGNAGYLHLPKLRTAAGDARAVARLLTERFGFATALELDQGRQLPLVLVDVGRREVFAALSQLRKRLGEDDSVLVFYAGHGDRPARAPYAYWLPVDAEADDHANWISAEEIANEISYMNARHVLVVADSCFSGALLRGVDLVTQAGTGQERARFLAEMDRRRSRHLMSSGANEPVMDEGGEGHSVFARAFLAGLEGMADDVFTAQQLFGSRIQEPVAGKAGQTPQYGPIQKSGHDGGDFVFRRSPAAPATGGLR